MPFPSLSARSASSAHYITISTAWVLTNNITYSELTKSMWHASAMISLDLHIDDTKLAEYAGNLVFEFFIIGFLIQTIKN